MLYKSPYSNYSTLMCKQSKLQKVVMKLNLCTLLYMILHGDLIYSACILLFSLHDLIDGNEDKLILQLNIVHRRIWTLIHTHILGHVAQQSALSGFQVSIYSAAGDAWWIQCPESHFCRPYLIIIQLLLRSYQLWYLDKVQPMAT